MAPRSGRPRIAAATRRHRRDGRQEALAVLEQWLAELAPRPTGAAAVGIAHGVI